MHWKLTTAGVALALAVAAIGASGVLAGDTDQGPGQDPTDIDVQALHAHRVSGPASASELGKVAGRPAKPNSKKLKPSKPQLIYLETDPLTLPPGPTGQVVEACPGSAKAINGYYFAQNVTNGFGLVNEGDSPAGLRRWSFYLKNETTAPISNVTFGMICIKGVR
jgi:hypothetical protein